MLESTRTEPTLTLIVWGPSSKVVMVQTSELIMVTVARPEASTLMLGGTAISLSNASNARMLTSNVASWSNVVFVKLTSRRLTKL